jgi:hypothetical protein
MHVRACNFIHLFDVLRLVLLPLTLIKQSCFVMLSAAKDLSVALAVFFQLTAAVYIPDFL